ncbi:hypothetical protein [Sutterella sp.]|uniref:hypothetical protein n=1 Tax=Sutterella sp. TaxID=1981025 RepID=UPI0026DF3164|nr:hypothetical protein [Sutterella sp.]MDO5531691.1 hypothetical protein [Sutterella sp.]
MPASSNSPCFTLELPLVVDSEGNRRLERDFAYALMLRNATLGTVFHQHNKMVRSPEWHNAYLKPEGPERKAAFKAVRKAYRLSGRNDFEQILLKHADDSKRKDELYSDIRQCVADDLYVAYSNWCYKDGGRPRFKSGRRGLHSLRGKTNKSAIMWDPELKAVRYGKHIFKAEISKKDLYAQKALVDPLNPSMPRKVRFCRIIRKRIRGKGSCSSSWTGSRP